MLLALAWTLLGKRRRFVAVDIIIIYAVCCGQSNKLMYVVTKEKSNSFMLCWFIILNGHVHVFQPVVTGRVVDIIFTVNFVFAISYR